MAIKGRLAFAWKRKPWRLCLKNQITTQFNVVALVASFHMLLLNTIYWAKPAAILENLGFKAADALHVAAAETAAADVLLSCDDRLCRLAQRCQRQLLVQVVNPLVWLQEVEYDPDA